MSNRTAGVIEPASFTTRVQSAAARLTQQRVLERLFAKDSTLWSSDAEMQRAIRNRLGWLTILPVMEQRLDEILEFARQVRQAGFTHALLLGMGGSSLFPEVCRWTFGISPGWLDLLILDTTDPSAILAAQRRAPLDRTLFLVSSKSGSTPEVNALCEYFYDQVQAIRGQAAGEQFVAITDVGTSLEALAAQRAFRAVFSHGPTTGQDVGGRFSAVTCFGLVPAALMGIDVRRLLEQEMQMLARCRSDTPAADNPAAQLGLTLHEAYSQGRDKVTLAPSSTLARFSAWAEQLLAESTGKCGQGLVPVDGEPVRSASAYPSDRLFVELQLASKPDEPLARHIEACARAGHPTIRFQWQDVYELGGEAVRWFLATAIAAWAMEINPFDEPNVQESKDRTKEMLARYVTAGAFPVEPPPIGDHADAVTKFLRQAREGDYLALLSFLPRTPEIDQAVDSLRTQLAQRLSIATTLGYGPRYLHSSGQLHKGGSDRGLFLVLTADDPLDVAIPGTPYTFGVLKQAQALGDVQALTAHQRRVLRVHFGAEPLAALRQLTRAITKHQIPSTK